MPDFECVAVENTECFASEFTGRGRVGKQGVRRTAQRQRMDRMLAGLSCHGEGDRHTAEPLEVRLVLLRQAHKFDASTIPLNPSDLR